MEQHPQTYRLIWQGIEIEARYWPRKWGVPAHLEIESIRPERAPLPITDTGYRSHFHQPGTIESLGGMWWHRSSRGSMRKPPSPLGSVIVKRRGRAICSDEHPPTESTRRTRFQRSDPQAA